MRTGSGGKGSVGGGEVGKKAKTTPDAGEKSVSEKSQATHTCRNSFEKSRGGMIYCHSKVFMVQATRLYSLICNLVDTCGLFRCT